MRRGAAVRVAMPGAARTGPDAAGVACPVRRVLCMPGAARPARTRLEHHGDGTRAYRRVYTAPPLPVVCLSRVCEARSNSNVVFIYTVTVLLLSRERFESDEIGEWLFVSKAGPISLPPKETPTLLFL